MTCHVNVVYYYYVYSPAQICRIPWGDMMCLSMSCLRVKKNIKKACLF